MRISRRKLLSASAKTAAATFLGSECVFATTEEVIRSIEEFTGSEIPVESFVRLKIPKIAENGNSVPLSVTVDGPMTTDEYVDSIMIVAEANPNPVILTFQFSPLSGEARARTRIRLADTQEVVAFAKLSNGKIFKAMQQVEVTIGGCH